jgi:DNA processing protein
MNDQNYYLAALQTVPGIGAKTIRKLVSFFDSPKACWGASFTDLKMAGLYPEQIKELLDLRKNYDFDAAVNSLKKGNIKLLTYLDDNYPILLKNTHNPPAVLFYKGALPNSDKILAMVGSRRASTYGKNIALKISEELSKSGVIIVSGGARGIDTFAHKGVLNNNGKTIAVMANGLDIDYPPENKYLFEEILDNNGTIITEYPLGTKPIQQNFPARNRIINGLSKGVIVIEAAFRSGSLITADFALEEGRDVFAVPGSIYSKTSEGTNKLIKQGAIPVVTVQDVLDEYHWLNNQSVIKEKNDLSEQENMILRLIPKDSTIHQELLILKSGLSPHVVSNILLQLLLKEVIREECHCRYTRYI